MSHASTIFALFPFLVGVMLLGIWSNIHAYAQQSSSSSPTLSPPTSNSVSKPISSELKAKICDPSNPDLKVVNTTEARICGIPKTVKPSLPSAPPTSAVSSSSSPPPPPTQQTITTKPPTTTVAAPKQQQIKAVNNTHMNAISRPAGGSGPGTTIAPVNHLINTSSSSSGIAPQIKAVNQQLQKQPPIKEINGTTGINSKTAAISSIAPPINNTAGQNYTFAAPSLPAASDQTLYLGYHSSTKSTHDNSGSKHDDNPHDDSKPDNRRTTRSATDGSSEDKETKHLSPPRIKNIATDNDSTAKSANDNSHSEDKIKSDTKPSHIKIIPPDSESKTKKKTTATSEEDVSPATKDNNNSKDKNNPDTESSSDHADSDNGFSLKNKRTKSDTKDSTSDDVSSKDNGDSSTKSSNHRARSSSSVVASDNDSTEEKKSLATNDGSNSKKGKSSHTDDDSKLFSSSSSDLALAIRNKVDSIIRNSLGGIGHNLFGFSDNGGF
jgi:hypothetical protein